MKGLFKANHPEKYAGNSKNIVYRSSYELKFMRYLDAHPEIESWASEEFSIPYISPVDGHMHRYYPDMIFKTIKGETTVIEIKPFKQCHPPKQGKNKRTFITEMKTYSVNQAKWRAAELYCMDRGWKFQLITEKELGIPG